MNFIFTSNVSETKFYATDAEIKAVDSFSIPSGSLGFSEESGLYTFFPQATQENSNELVTDDRLGVWKPTDKGWLKVGNNSQLSNLNLGGNSTHYVSFIKPAADGAANTVMLETPIFQTAVDITIQSIVFIPAAALTADNTNYAIFNIARRSTPVSEFDYVVRAQTTIPPTAPSSTGNFTQFVPVNFLPLAVTELAAGDQLTLEISKVGSGVVVPAGTLQIEYTAD
jgi:hypothetical protein